MKGYGKDCLIELLPNEIAGKKTIDAINKFLRNITTNSEEIDIHPNPMGSISIDYISRDDDYSQLVIYHTFRAYKDGTTFKISGGSIRFPGAIRGANEASWSNDGGAGMKYWVNVPKEGTATITRGSDYPSYIDSSTYDLNLPLCYINDSGNLVYRHIGDYFFTIKPYQWIADYDEDIKQSLDHNSSGLVWTDYEECE